MRKLRIEDITKFKAWGYLKIAWLVLLACLSQGTTAQTHECRMADVKNIIGGPDYTVDKMLVAHQSQDTWHQMIVGGRFTVNETQETGAYLYSYEYLTCEVVHQLEFANVNQGWHAIQIQNDFTYVVGYHYDEETDNIFEVVVIIETEKSTKEMNLLGAQYALIG